MSIEYAVDHAVAVITLSRPDRLNALDQAMTIDLLAAVAAAAADDSVRAVVLTGAGRGFCAGGDTSASPELVFAGLAAEIEWTQRHAAVSALLHEMPKPTIAAVNGPCAGVGMSFAAACDLRFAAETAVFVTSYRSAGLPGDGAIAWTLTRLIGAGRARELMLLSPKITANRALEIGLVNRVLPGAELMPQTLAVAADLATAHQPAIAAMKADFADLDRLDIRSYIEIETDRHVRCRRTSD